MRLLKQLIGLTLALLILCGHIVWVIAYTIGRDPK